MLLLWLAATPRPTPTAPILTPGTTTPIADLLRSLHLEILITIGAAVASLVQIIAVFRTLASVGHGRKQQAELIRKQEAAYVRQEAILRRLGIDPDDPPTADSSR